MTLTSCLHPGCGVLMTKRPRPRCPQHQAEFEQRRRERLQALPNRALYSTPAWKKARKLMLEAAGHACQACGVTGATLDVHHISPHADPLAPSNLRALCRSCHLRAQHAVRKEREARGRW